MLIKESKIILGGVMALKGGGGIKLRGFGVITRNAVAMLVEIAKEELRVEIILEGVVADRGEGGIVAGNRGIFVEKELGELGLSGGVARLSAGFEFENRGW